MTSVLEEEDLEPADPEDTEPAAKRKRVLGPDFLCVGMPRSATGWLYDQLRHHSEFWLPPIKELHYFQGNFPRKKFVHRFEYLKRLRNPKKVKRAAKRRNRIPWGPHEFQFAGAALACRGRGIDFPLYKNLFTGKDGFLSGELTPSYCGMPDEMIAQIAENLPETKFVLLIRDPVSRQWSRMGLKDARARRIERRSNPEDMKKFFSGVDLPLAFPSQIYKRWSRYVAPGNLRYFFFDDIQAKPDETMAEILRYIGADPSKRSTLKADYNRKATRGKKAVLEGNTRQILVDYFRDELHACAETFGGPALDWPKRYGL